MATETVKNHGISEEKIAAALAAMQLYFALPLEEKMKVCYAYAMDVYRTGR